VADIEMEAKNQPNKNNNKKQQLFYSSTPLAIQNLKLPSYPNWI